MAKIINVEKSQFINENIDIYTSNRLGQYSKFLDKSPFFVTYYSVNEAQSTADFGTGNIDKVFGSSSPIRYNKITHLPVYNMPELKPDVVLEDSDGVDFELELSDITFLPNTVKPRPYDLMLVELPGASPILFMVNNFRLNTVQSNDFYMADMAMKAYGENAEAKVESQIVESYQTVFENIGTQDKCFIRTDDVDKINTLVRTINLLRESYINNFYDSLTNSFILQNNESNFKVKSIQDPVTGQYSPSCEFCASGSKANEETYKWEDIYYHHDNVLYDPFLEHFITRSGILNDPDRSQTYVLTQNDILQDDFNALYSKSLYASIEKHHALFLEPYMYYFQSPVKKAGSIYKIYGKGTNSVKLLESDFDRFLNPEIKMESYRTTCVNFFQRTLEKYEEQSEHYTEDDMTSIRKILTDAKIDIYAKNNFVEMTVFSDNIDKILKAFKTIEMTRKEEIISGMEEHLNSLDKLRYSEDSISKMHELLSSYKHIMDNAPYHVYDSAWEKFVSDVAEIPMLSDEEYVERVRQDYITELQACYSFYIESGLTAEEIDALYTECLMVIESAESKDAMVSAIIKFTNECDLLVTQKDVEDEEVEDNEQ